MYASKGFEVKNILVFTHAGGSPWHGPNTRWYYLASALRPRGYNAEIVSSSFFHKYINPPEVSKTVHTQTIGGVLYHFVRTMSYKGRGLGQILNQLHFTLKCLVNWKVFAERQPQVVVASSPHPFVVLPALLLSRRTGARFVYEVRDLWPDVLMELGGYSRFHPYIVALGLVERLAVRCADRLVSVKPGDGDYFSEKYGTPESLFSYVPNGFLPGDEETPPPAELLELRNRYAMLVVFVGAVSAAYRLKDLADLAERVLQSRDVGFVIIGKGDRLAQLEADGKARGLQNLHFLGGIARTSVGPSLMLADICYIGVVSNHRYGISSNKIYEYMAAGKPILASYRTAHDPVVAAKCGIVCEPGDIDSLTAALGELMDNPEACKAYGENAKRYFERNHDFRAVASRAIPALFGDDYCDDYCDDLGDHYDEESTAE